MTVIAAMGDGLVFGEGAVLGGTFLAEDMFLLLLSVGSSEKGRVVAVGSYEAKLTEVS